MAEFMVRYGCFGFYGVDGDEVPFEGGDGMKGG